MLLRVFCRNPFLPFGLIAFAIVFAFVCHNTFSRQNAVSRRVFAQTCRLEHAGISAQEDNFLSKKNTNRRESTVNSLDIDLENMQKKLVALGLYSSRINDLNRSQTKNQEQQRLQKDSMNVYSASSKIVDEISAIIHDGQSIDTSGCKEQDK